MLADRRVTPFLAILELWSFAVLVRASAMGPVGAAPGRAVRARRLRHARDRRVADA
jgi:hypothetical protein